MLTACVAARVQAHPVLGTPFFGAHPCRTAELMALLLPGREASGKAAGQAAGEVCVFRCHAVVQSLAPVVHLQPALKSSTRPLRPSSTCRASLKPGSRLCPQACGFGSAPSAPAAGGPVAGKCAMDGDAALRYLLAWFSVVGAAVGLRLPLDLLARNLCCC